MSEFILVLTIICVSFAGIFIGSILNKKPISGSCGGLANLEAGASCKICGRTNNEVCDS